MEFLPTELLQNIFSYLSDNHVDAIKLTNRKLHTVVCDPSTERMRHKYQFGEYAWDLAGKLIDQVGREKALYEYVNIPQKEKGGNLNVVKALLVRGATVFEDSFVVPAWKGFVDVTIALLDALENPEHLLDRALFETAMGCKPKGIQYLIKHGADLKRVVDEGDVDAFISGLEAGQIPEQWGRDFLVYEDFYKARVFLYLENNFIFVLASPPLAKPHPMNEWGRSLKYYETYPVS